MYSQNAEEGVINSLFGDAGRFLDVGAFDGKTFSNTLRLYERGWDGVLVEPSPSVFPSLEKMYGKDNPRAKLVRVAIGACDGYTTFYDSRGDAISTTVPAHVAKWKAGYNCQFDDIPVALMSWGTLFDLVGADFQFVNIDTEATNLELLKLFPFGRCMPTCICIEHDSEYAAMTAIVAPHGFREVYRSGENLIFARG